MYWACAADPENANARTAAPISDIVFVGDTVATPRLLSFPCTRKSLSGFAALSRGLPRATDAVRTSAPETSVNLTRSFYSCSRRQGARFGEARPQVSARPCRYRAGSGRRSVWRRFRRARGDDEKKRAAYPRLHECNRHAGGCCVLGSGHSATAQTSATAEHAKSRGPSVLIPELSSPSSHQMPCPDGHATKGGLLPR